MNALFAVGVVLSVVTLRVFGDTLYVSFQSPNSTPPYRDWQTAASGIQDAIAAARPGDEILVSNGVYRTGAVRLPNGLCRIALTNAVLVQSAQGPGVTIIEGESTGTRCAYVGDGAVLNGFTLTNGVSLIGQGGGAYCEALGVVTNCVLTGNSAGNGGGAFGGTLSSCIVSSNSAGSGGGVYSCTVSNSFLTGNSSSRYGGGASESTLYTCTLSGNTGWLGGGAEGGKLYSCLLANNSAWSGGGSIGGALYNCTVVGNSASGSAGGVSGGLLYNCVVYFNAATNGPDYGDATFEHCCTSPLPAGMGNIDRDPLFVNLDGGDFQLAAGSPCIDAGDDSFAVEAVDLLGQPRVMDGDRDGVAHIDMGAYEFNPYRIEVRLPSASGSCVIVIEGEPQQTVEIQQSKDLRNWEGVGSVSIPVGGQTVCELPLASLNEAFYRAAHKIEAW
jgi:hypothetical protein